MKSVAFDWLNKFHQNMEKDPAYADKTLAAYRLGMRGKGSIAGVVVQPAQDCCEAARQLPQDQIYHPDEAPHLPLPQCTQERCCACVYRPVMSYQRTDES
jgi:hypothetical protein